MRTPSAPETLGSVTRGRNEGHAPAKGLAILILFFLAVLDVSLSAQTTGGQEALLLARELARRGEISEAERTLLSLARGHDTPDPLRAAAWNNLGSLYKALGRIRQGEGAFLKSIAIWERVTDGAGPSGLAQPLNNLAGLYAERRQFDAAEELYNRTLSIRRKTFGEQSIEVARALGNVALLRLLEGRHQEAVVAFREVLARYGAVNNPDPADVSGTQTNLGLAHLQKRRYADAEHFLTLAVATLEQSARQYDERLVVAISNLAELRIHQKKYADADRLIVRALDTAHQKLGPDHSLIGAILARHSEVLRKLSRKREAQESQQRSKAILTKSGVGFTVHIAELINQ